MSEIEAVVADDRERRGSSARLQCGRDVCSPYPFTSALLAKQHGDHTDRADGEGPVHGNRRDLNHWSAEWMAQMGEPRTDGELARICLT